MLRRFLGVALICAVVASAHADVYYDFVPVENTTVLPGSDPAVPDFNDGSFYTFDLVGTIVTRPEWGSEGWLGAVATATIEGPATFFLHPQGGDIPSDPNLVAQYPALEFDTYFTTMSGTPPWFPPGSPSYSGPGGGIITQIDVEWQDTNVVSLWEGTLQLARFSLQTLGAQSVTLTVEGAGGQASSPGPLFPFGPFVVTIPEPSTLALLALGGLLVVLRPR